jgi:TetR/AcrR family transcriptional repressor of mexJK operon
MIGRRAIPKRHGAARLAAADTPKMMQLIAAAEDIFLAKGYHTATMSDVAKAAGMSKKTVYQLIESKAALFVELLAHQQSLLVYPEPRPEWSLNDVLVENLVCLARFLLSPQQIAIIRLIMAEYTHSPDLGRAFHKKGVMKARNRMETCLGEIALKQGFVLRDPREMSAMLFGMAMGEFHLGVLIGFRAAPGRAALERRIRCAVELFMTGLGNNPCARDTDHA